MVKTEDLLTELNEAGMVDHVDRHVRPLVDWYQRKKRLPRRLHLAASTLMPAVGTATMAAGFLGHGELASTAGGLSTITLSVTLKPWADKWLHKWQIFTWAQTEVEILLERWEWEMAEIAELEGKRAATRRARDEAAEIRRRETEAFFRSQGVVDVEAA